MQTVDDKPIETIHLYVVREDARKPPSPLPVILAVLCVLVMIALTVYSGTHPSYEHQALRLPAQFLPLHTFSATERVIPTGTKTYAATTAHGILAITNGSIIAQVIPTGFTISNVATDATVYVPPGSANGYGYATVKAHALIRGKGGNFAAMAINQVIGSSVYIRNLSAFRGGQNSYSVRFATAHDKQAALLHAQGILSRKTSGLHYPCAEGHIADTHKMIVTWRCQFVTYHIPAFYHVTEVRIVGKNLLIDVWFVARPVRIWVK